MSYGFSDVPSGYTDSDLGLYYGCSRHPDLPSGALALAGMLALSGLAATRQRFA